MDLVFSIKLAAVTFQDLIYGIKIQYTAHLTLLKLLDMDRSKNRIMYLGDSENDNARLRES